MNAAVVLLLFLGMAIVMHGIYVEKVKTIEQNVRVEYRFIPRTTYEEQMSTSDLAGRFNTMFARAEPWLDGRDRGGADVGSGHQKSGSPASM